ncbi:MAG: M56 family metallopeptidase [Oscillospiraceae bacterium]|nr:M56 family metallopeptidase [Oscillospiraceae bacterium]
MTNIWGFLLQSLSVTLVALVLRIVKLTFEEQLPPRWQYGVWSVLALRALLPVPMGRECIVPFVTALEMLKTWVEKQLPQASAFTEAYRPIATDHVLPVITGKPASVTDWLFVIYAIGVAAFALWYVLRYVQLRILLRKGSAPDFATEAQLIRVRKRYGLPKCPAVMADGIDSPFVCGVVKPVLVIPKGKAFDDKVMLHELLHLRSHDGAQSLFWCALRCLHWCNPAMHYICNRIGNDMEALCDQRVLELVDGEERRDYGMILLTMANDRYARAPGTTSLSNGGDNIAKRIETIVRFKKYPKGMGLVSVCIALLLAVPSVMGTAVAYDQADLQPGSVDDLPRAMALARLERCDTVAGALDTYAKGLLNENGIYIAMVSPYSEHEALEHRMRAYNEDGWYACKLPAGEKLEYLNDGSYDDHFKYAIYELEQQSDGTYTAWLAFGVRGFADEQGNLVQETNSEDRPAFGTRRVTVPVEVYYRDGWCVREIGERSYSFVPFNIHGNTLDYALEAVPHRSYQKEGSYGTLTVTERMQYIVDESMEGWHPFGVEGLNGAVDPDGEFVSIQLRSDYDYGVNDVDDRVYAMMACVLPSARSETKLPHSFVGLDGTRSSGYTDYVYVRQLDERLHLYTHQQSQLIEELNTADSVYGYHVKIGRYEEDPKGNVIGTEICDELIVTKEDVYEP